MTENDYGFDLNMSEDRLMKEMMAKHKANSQSLMEESLKKQEKEKSIMANIFTKLAKKEEEIPKEAAPLNEEGLIKGMSNLPSAIPPKPTKPIIVTQQLNREVPKEAKSVNNENEPTAINWRRVSVQQLHDMYPKSRAVSDLYMVLHSALQQPGMACALIAPHGTQYLVKSDESGNLFVSAPDPNPKAFTNVGLNPDFDGDKVDDAKGVNPAKPFSTNSHRILAYNKNEDKEFSLDHNFNEKVEEATKRVELPADAHPKIRSIVDDLRDQAARLRGEEPPSRPLYISPVSPTGSISLVEDTTQNSVSVKRLNNLLFKAQQKFNQTSNKLYEDAAEDISEAIAEALLSDKTSVPINKLKNSTRKIKW